MTTPVSGDWIEEEPQSGLIPEEAAWEETGGFPVRVTNQPEQIEAPEFGSCMTWTLPVAPAPPLAILQRRLRRSKARLRAYLEYGMSAVVLNSNSGALTGANPVGFWAYSPSAIPDGTTGYSVHGAIAALTAGSIQMPPGDGLSTFTITLSSPGTANMTITTSNVANVTNGPLTWTIPAGQTALTVNFPQPLQPKLVTPITISWTSTAGAVGDINAQGPSMYIPGFDLPDWKSQQPLYVVAVQAFEFQVNPQSFISVLDESYGDIRVG